MNSCKGRKNKSSIIPLLGLHPDLYLQVIHHEAIKKDHLLKMRSKENTKENDTGLQLRKIQSETSQAEALLEGQLKVGPNIRHAQLYILDLEVKCLMTK